MEEVDREEGGSEEADEGVRRLAGEAGRLREKSPVSKAGWMLVGRNEVFGEGECKRSEKS